MSFTPMSDSQLDARGGALKLIFDQLTPAAPFEVNNAQTQWVFDLKVRSESVDEQTYENFVQAHLKIMIVNNSKIVMSREFKSETTLSLKNIDASDHMLGTLRDIDTGATVLSIDATRTASADEATSLKNPWIGTLSLVEVGHNHTKVGDIKGFFSGLLAK